jgi:hypothetical protein
VAAPVGPTSEQMQVDCSPTPVSDTQGPRSLPVALALNAVALLTENYDDDDADDDYPMLVLDSDMDSEDEYDSETGSAHEFMVSNQEVLPYYYNDMINTDFLCSLQIFSRVAPLPRSQQKMLKFHCIVPQLSPQ